MSDSVSGPGAAYHGSADLVASTDRLLRRVAIGALAALLIVSVTVIVWAAGTFGSQISALRSEVRAVTEKQTQFHQDTVSQNAALNTATKTDECQARALNAILAELAAAQSAVDHHKSPSKFVYPRPC